MVASNAIRVLEQKKGGWVHAFLLDDPAGLTLIDTLYDTDAHRLVEAIKAMGKEVTDLKHIVVSHGHRSHLGGLAAIKKMSGATVLAHAWEADILAGEREAQRVPIRPQRPILAYAPVYYLQFGAAVGFGRCPPCLVDETVREGDKVGSLQVVHAPGHTPGHCGFWWEEHKALFTGDAIVTYPRFAPGWPAFTLNYHQQNDSVHRLAEVGAEFVGVGHGDPITEDAAEKIRLMVKAADASRLLHG